jgi:hypothetical protein
LSGVLGAAFVAATIWLTAGGEELSVRDILLLVGVSLLSLVGVPIILFRWRMILEPEELLLVWASVRRVALVEVVDAKCVANQGLVFVLRDGSEEAFGALGNTAWDHRRRNPTTADLAARAVLCAAATARGEDPPIDFRLPPLRGLKKAAVRGGIVSAILGFLLSS